LDDVAPDDSPADWARRFIASDRQASPILVGYSLGGRLALHALLQAPQKWRAAVLISTHPGLSSESERERRRAHDAQWAERFDGAPWETVIAQWNAQPVFAADRAVPPREENRFDRGKLALALRQWSLGSQTDLSDRLGELKLPVLWIAGELDSKFADLARRSAALCPQGRFSLIPGAGHRVLFDQPEGLAEAIQTFLKEESR
jgi:2-succinyl-6-hydroxy-2,4-cyclohexadiene-1-carboxylate synthase